VFAPLGSASVDVVTCQARVLRSMRDKSVKAASRAEQLDTRARNTDDSTSEHARTGNVVASKLCSHSRCLRTVKERGRVCAPIDRPYSSTCSRRVDSFISRDAASAVSTFGSNSSNCSGSSCIQIYTSVVIVCVRARARVRACMCLWVRGKWGGRVSEECACTCSVCSQGLCF
jgi:hypothetical protein